MEKITWKYGKGSLEGGTVLLGICRTFGGLFFKANEGNLGFVWEGKCFDFGVMLFSEKVFSSWFHRDNEVVWE